MSSEIKEIKNVETNSIYSGMNDIFACTRNVIDTMQNGEKISYEDLIDKVQSQIQDVPVGNVSSLVRIFIKDCKDVSVEVGRGGGIFKGGKPRRVDMRPRCHACNQVVRPAK